MRNLKARRQQYVEYVSTAAKNMKDKTRRENRKVPGKYVFVKKSAKYSINK